MSDKRSQSGSSMKEMLLTNGQNDEIRRLASSPNIREKESKDDYQKSFKEMKIKELLIINLKRVFNNKNIIKKTLEECMSDKNKENTTRGDKESKEESKEEDKEEKNKEEKNKEEENKEEENPLNGPLKDKFSDYLKVRYMTELLDFKANGDISLIKSNKNGNCIAFQYKNDFYVISLLSSHFIIKNMPDKIEYIKFSKDDN